jgi:hypothetical protein
MDLIAKELPIAEKPKTDTDAPRRENARSDSDAPN